jgi:sigma-B regulation protein RsbU (phosphoserine phosphatase)
MPTLASCRTLLCADQPSAVADVRRLLEDSGHAVTWHALGDGNPPEVASIGLAVLEGSPRDRLALSFCRRLRARLASGFVPILFVTADPAPAARLAALDSGADACLLRPFVSGELLAQVRALLTIKDLHDRLAKRTAEVRHVNQRLQLAHRQIDEGLALARRVQHSFLPPTLPEMPQARLAVHHRPRAPAGGNFYDIFRLDADQVGLYVADAVGHGLPAGLLAISVQRAVRAVTTEQQSLLAPGAVLRQLNHDLIDLALADDPFLTMVYVQLDSRDGTLQVARAGHLCPLYLPCNGEPYRWRADSGSLLGMCDTEFPVQTQRLRPGDKMLLCTCGVDGETGATDDILLTGAGRHRARPIAQLVAELARQLTGEAGRSAEWTLLGLEMVG